MKPSQKKRLRAEKPAHPTTDEIRKARKSAKHSQAAAGAIVHVSGRAWRAWELGTYKMPIATWELYLLRTQAVIRSLPPQLDI